ncbi:MAG TPA: peptidylprolyl isomerase [Candidatus Saccharimonadales bacterium]|nr:peptidylprolyl isomerase [Candidatus Saccharimonadales bacterium]
MKKTLSIPVAAALALALVIPAAVRAAEQAPQSQPAAAKAAPAKSAPAKTAAAAHIQVQHILIGFNGTVPGKMITRTQAEAKKLAYEILKRARKGEPFDSLVKKYTDDQFPGIYGMSNTGVAPATGEYPREKMVPAFGDVGFGLKVGQIGIADYSKAKSQFGWHIIKRLK